MLVLRSRPPVSYELCNQTVTIYHTDGKNYSKTVVNNAFLDYQKNETAGKDGRRESNGFTLIIEGPPCVSVGDKIMAGEGPDCTTREEWAALIPARVAGLVVVQYVSPKYWHGEIIHTEAGA